jgi:adenylylsulfate reductase subunit B
VKECPAQAVVFFLGADIGGRGSTLIVAGEGDVLHWQVRRPDGTTQVVDIDRKNANKY